MDLKEPEAQREKEVESYLSLTRGKGFWRWFYVIGTRGSKRLNHSAYDSIEPQDRENQSIRFSAGPVMVGREDGLLQWEAVP